MRWGACISFVLGIFLNFNIAGAEPNWTWFYSSEYVSDYYDPSSLKIIRDYSGNVDHIEIWTKTTYSQAGAEDTINNYNLTKVSRIYDLDSSLSKIFIYPSKRKILYQNEVFYSTDGAVLWHKEKSTYAAGTDVEAGSSDERYFSIIIDLAFHGGNQIDFAKWEEGKERWMYLGEFESSKGGTKGIWFDTKLMSLNGNIVSTWIISEYYAEKEKVEKDCIKWSFDISGRKSKIERMSAWKKDRGWYMDNEEAYEAWKEIIPASMGEFYMNSIKQYVCEHRAEIIENMHMR